MQLHASVVFKKTKQTPVFSTFYRQFILYFNYCQYLNYSLVFDEIFIMQSICKSPTSDWFGRMFELDKVNSINLNVIDSTLYFFFYFVFLFFLFFLAFTFAFALYFSFFFLICNFCCGSHKKTYRFFSGSVNRLAPFQKREANVIRPDSATARNQYYYYEE